MIVSSTADTIGTIDYSGADKAVAKIADIDTAYATIAAGGILRVTSVDDDTGTDVKAGLYFVLAHRIV